MIDMDLDSTPEFLFATYFDTIFYVYKMNGERYNNFYASIYPDTFIEFQLAVGDLDRNGENDLIVGAAHYLFAFDRFGNRLPGWPVQFRTNQYLTYLGTPVLADIDNDGWLEVLVSTERVGDGRSDEGWVEVFRYDGSIQPGWPIYWDSGMPRTAPVVGDIDGDADLEIVMVGLDLSEPNGTYMWALEADGSILPGWPIGTENMFSFDPIIGDLDGDSYPDILIGSQMAYSDGDSIWSHYWAYDYEGRLLPGWPLRVLSWNGSASACLGDFDMNGTANIVLSSCGERSFYYDEGQESYLWMYELGFPYDSSNVEWPQAGHDRWNSSNYEFREPPISSVDDGPQSLPYAFYLQQNYPNPFNSSTSIKIGIPRKAEVTIAIYNLMGQRVETLINAQLERGDYALLWNVADFPSGIYFARLTSGKFVVTRRMALIK